MPIGAVNGKILMRLTGLDDEGVRREAIAEVRFVPLTAHMDGAPKMRRAIKGQ